MSSAGSLTRVVALCAVLVTSAFAELQVTTDLWDGGFKATPCVDITRDTHAWRAHVTFSVDVDSIEVWTATSTKLTSRHYRLDDLYNSDLKAGDQLCFTFTASCSACDQTPDISVYVEGSRSTKDYAHGVELSLLFYAAQRSGKLPSNNPIYWRGDSALGDCVTGGWYDAGDHVKFGLPMAASTTMLTWSLIKFKAGYQRAGQLDEMYDSIKWPLDYFLKAWDSEAQELVVQVGDGYEDHKHWVRPEDMTMPRPCLKVTEKVNGSDIAAETAASLAGGAIVFQDKGDVDYAEKLLTSAKSLYEFAKTHRGCFEGAEPFYTSSNEADELCLGAMFLYKATRDSKYLEEAKTFANWNTAWALTWDNKELVCQILLQEETGYYKEPIENFFTSWQADNGMTYTPCGLAWRDKWGTNRYAANAAFAALMAADLGINSAAYRKWAVEQINFLLGDNTAHGKCFSFQVGYGEVDSYPHFAHHRGASCPDKPETCNYKNEKVSTRNPHILYGALVGGPDSAGHYQDLRTDYEANEVTTDYNAGFQGALAGIVQLETSPAFPVTDNKCPCTH